MVANIDTMFSVKEVPWHGLGNIVDGDLLSEEAIVQAGLGWEVEATAGTSGFFRRWGLPAASVEKGESLVAAIREKRWDLIVNVAGSRLGELKDGYAIRRAAIETGIPCVSSLPVASALALAYAVRRGNMKA